MSDDVVLLYDFTGAPVVTTAAPVTNRPGGALTSPQGGILGLGSDYASSPAAQVPKVDAYGSQYVVASNPLGAPASVANLSSVSSAASAYGQLMLGLNGTQYTAATADATGALSTYWTQFPAFTCIAPYIPLSSGASLLAVLNQSTSSVLRLVDMYVTNASTGGVLGTGNAFVVLELHRITALTATGTAITPMAHDPSDVLASGITARSLCTGVTESSTAPVKRMYVSNGGLAVGASTAEANALVLQQQLPYVGRNDITAKVLTIRPATGLHLKIMSTVTAGYFDVTMVFTQAAA